MSDTPEPDYREVRRWAIQQPAPIRPSDLQRAYRVGFNRAAGILEELERDGVLRHIGPCQWTAGR